MARRVAAKLYLPVDMKYSARVFVEMSADGPGVLVAPAGLFFSGRIKGGVPCRYQARVPTRPLQSFPVHVEKKTVGESYAVG
jgi:hypothetical protein